MTTARDIVKKAHREAGIIQQGEDPSAEALFEGLELLNGIVLSLVGNEAGTELTDTPYGRGANIQRDNENTINSTTYIDTYFSPDNINLILNLNSAKTVYFNPTPEDGARMGIVDAADNLATYNLIIHGNGRTIEDAVSVTLNTNGLNREWFYRADLGNWVRLTELEAGDPSPFPRKYDDLLSTMLAIRLNPRYGAVLDGQTISAMSRMRTQFRAQYRQTSEVSPEIGTIFTSFNKRNYYDSVGDANLRFGKGFI